VLADLGDDGAFVDKDYATDHTSSRLAVPLTFATATQEL
jgi:hypothetical protein